MPITMPKIVNAERDLFTRRPFMAVFREFLKVTELRIKNLLSEAKFGVFSSLANLFIAFQKAVF